MPTQARQATPDNEQSRYLGFVEETLNDAMKHPVDDEAVCRGLAVMHTLEKFVLDGALPPYFINKYRLGIQKVMMKVHSRANTVHALHNGQVSLETMILRVTHKMNKYC